MIAFALKQQAEAEKTTILDIIWQTGKTGRITPVAIMEPVKMEDGATVSRASLSNVAIYSAMRPTIGCTAKVVRSGGIIPYITEVLDNEEFTPEIPDCCPVCHSTKLETTDTGLLFCRAPTCTAKSSGALINHCKKLKMKGFGPKTVEKLAVGGVITITELYSVSQETLVELLDSEKLGAKLFEEIQAGSTTTLSRAIASLGITLIGDTAAKKLALEIQTLAQLQDITPKTVAGIGNKAVENIQKYVTANPFMLEELDELLTISVDIVVEASSELGVVCITGKIPGYTKASAKQFLEEQGYKVVSTVTKDCTILVSDGKPSAKLKQAQDRDLLITKLDSLTG